MPGSTKFEWDDANRGHVARHGITPEEFEQAIENGPALIAEPVVKGEARVHAVGVTSAGRLLEVIYTVRRAKVRAVTAYPVNRSKREAFHGKFAK